MLYAVIFRNKREELIIRAQEARNEQEAVDMVVQQWEKEYGEGDDPEGINYLWEPYAEEIKSGMGIYHQDRS